MRKVRLLAVVTVLVIVGAACGREGVPAGSQSLDVVTTEYAFNGVPDTISGGVINVTFTNEGEAVHELGFAQIGDTSVEAFTSDLAAIEEGGPFPSYLTVGSVLSEIEPGQSIKASINLPPGDYLLFCTLTDAPGEGEEEVEAHTALGMHQQVAVEGEGGELEADGGDFVATDYTFEAPENLQAGANEFVFRNDGPTQWHHMIVQEYAEGTTAEQATQAFQASLTAEPGADPPPGTPSSEMFAATGIYSPGLGQTFEANFKSGRTYVAVCFIQDLAGGPPHAIAHQMYKAFTVG